MSTLVKGTQEAVLAGRSIATIPTTPGQANIPEAFRAEGVKLFEGYQKTYGDDIAAWSAVAGDPSLDITGDMPRRERLRRIGVRNFAQRKAEELKRNKVGEVQARNERDAELREAKASGAIQKALHADAMYEWDALQREYGIEKPIALTPKEELELLREAQKIAKMPGTYDTAQRRMRRFMLEKLRTANPGLKKPDGKTDRKAEVEQARTDEIGRHLKAWDAFLQSMPEQQRQQHAQAIAASRAAIEAGSSSFAQERNQLQNLTATPRRKDPNVVSAGTTREGVEKWLGEYSELQSARSRIRDDDEKTVKTWQAQVDELKKRAPTEDEFAAMLAARTETGGPALNQEETRRIYQLMRELGYDPVAIRKKMGLPPLPSEQGK